MRPLTYRHRLYDFLHRLTTANKEPASPAMVVFDRGRQALLRGNRWVAVPPIAARILMALLDQSGTIVAESTLIHAGWLGEPRGPSDLYKQIRTLRILLEVDPHRPGHLITRRGVGYLLQDVTETTASRKPGKSDGEVGHPDGKGSPQGDSHGTVRPR